MSSSVNMTTMMKMNKYTIVIGDVHGRVNWRQLVYPLRDDCTYVFLGDFSDPYYSIEDITYEQMIEQAREIFALKEKYPDKIVILASNHDLQYILDYPETNRFEYRFSKRQEMHHTFYENSHLIDGVAYNIGDKYLISHAGVTYEWYTSHCDYDNNNVGKEPLEEIAKKINTVWKNNKESFMFLQNAKMSDYYGESSGHSPVWVRPYTLWCNNLFGFDSGRIQVVGHTYFELEEGFAKTTNEVNRIGTVGTIKKQAPDEVIERGSPLLDNFDICQPIGNDKEHVDIIMTDCLRRETACVEINNETLKWRKIYLGDVENSKIKW